MNNYRIKNNRYQKSINNKKFYYICDNNKCDNFVNNFVNNFNEKFCINCIWNFSKKRNYNIEIVIEI